MASPPARTGAPRIGHGPFLRPLAIGNWPSAICGTIGRPLAARPRRNLPPTPPEEHYLKATLWSLGNRRVYFADNAATSGNAMRAAYAAMRRGAVLVFADAGRHTHPQHQQALL